jgi:hypothetical protein
MKTIIAMDLVRFTSRDRMMENTVLDEFGQPETGASVLHLTFSDNVDSEMVRQSVRNHAGNIAVHLPGEIHSRNGHIYNLGELTSRAAEYRTRVARAAQSMFPRFRRTFDTRLKYYAALIDFAATDPLCRFYSELTSIPIETRLVPEAASYVREVEKVYRDLIVRYGLQGEKKPQPLFSLEMDVLNEHLRGLYRKSLET